MRERENFSVLRLKIISFARFSHVPFCIQFMMIHAFFVKMVLTIFTTAFNVSSNLSDFQMTMKNNFSFNNCLLAICMFSVTKLMLLKVILAVCAGGLRIFITIKGNFKLFKIFKPYLDLAFLFLYSGNGVRGLIQIVRCLFPPPPPPP